MCATYILQSYQVILQTFLAGEGKVASMPSTSRLGAGLIELSPVKPAFYNRLEQERSFRLSHFPEPVN